MVDIYRSIRAGLLGLALFLVVGCPESRPPSCERERLEQTAAAAGKRFVLVPYAVPENKGARSITIAREDLSDCELYLRDPQSSDYLLIDNTASVIRNETRLAELERHAELLFAAGRTTLFIDGMPLEQNFHGWQTGWLTERDSPPEVENSASPLVDYADAFTRLTLDDDRCRIESGKWWLRKRGGGMPSTDWQAEQHQFQRAVNPFSARGSGNGCLSYGDESWLDCRGAASFYFGIPRQGHIIDRDSLPVGTDMLLMWGTKTGPCVQFGWFGERGAFKIRYRDSATAEWQILDTYSGPRPAATNWLRLELVIAAGYRLSARLDGVEIASRNLPTKVGGPFSICSGEGEMEFDDVEIRSLALGEQAVDSLYRSSELFAAKDLKDERHDPQQFLEWARGAKTFIQWEDSDTSGQIPALKAMTRFPLLADFDYQSAVGTAEQTEEAICHGTYTFSFVPTDSVDVEERPAADDAALSFSVRLDSRGWSALDLPAEIWPPELVAPRLEFRRRAGRDDPIGFKCDGIWRHLEQPLNGAVRVVITFVADEPRKLPPVPRPPYVHWNRSRPHPTAVAAYRERMERYRTIQFAPVNAARHRFKAPDLYVELFEKSPVDWAWIEGAFRMDCRWACQDNWNFMACGSQGVPMVTSKRTFGGDQVHEYYLSLRPVFPWEVGDETFSYDYALDDQGRTFRENRGWYNRRDFDFSFCFDGKNPLSGYTVMFGTDDNETTRLLRRGRVIASTTDPEFLFPKEYGHGAVHWEWWKFTVSRIGKRIQVRLNDKLMFDFEDPDPLPGGHIALWSIRNGFAVARINSVAERVAWRPQVLYVTDNPDTPWRPMPADSAGLSHDVSTGMTTARRNVGAGFYALRYELQDNPDLARFPILELPLELGDTVAVNLHLQIGGKAYSVQIAAPVEKTKSLLAPEFERGECFQIPDMALTSSYRNLGQAEVRDGILTIDLGRALDALDLPDTAKRLESVTLGNTSNASDLLIGGGSRNLAGAEMRVGKPRFLARGHVQ